jgi:membrane-associated phospholipid phosphatase
VDLLDRPAAEVGADVAGRGPARRLVIASVVATALAAVVYVVFVRTALGQRVDNAALLGALQQQPQVRLDDQSFLGRISADSLFAVLVVIAVVGLVRRRPRLGIAAAAAAGVAVVVTDLLKYSILSRPTIALSDTVMPVNTFPSGHTATALACALALVLVSPPAWRGLAAVVAGSYGWLVAARVQTAGWHRPSDAIGGALLAFAAVSVTAAVVTAWRPVVTGRGGRHLVAFGVLGAILLVFATLTAVNVERVLRVLVGQRDVSTFPFAVSRDAYQVSVNGTVVVVVCLLIALLALLGRYDLDEPAPGLGLLAVGGRNRRSAQAD